MKYKEGMRDMHVDSKGTKYYVITGSSGCLSTDYLYMSKKISGTGIVPEPKESSANDYPKR